MKNALFFLLTAALGIMQSSLLNYLQVFRAKPDLLLICTVLAALFLRPAVAIMLAIFAGLIQDSIGACPFGINTALFVLWSFLALKLNRKISLENNFLRAGVVFAAALLHNIISGMALFYLGRNMPFGILLRIILVASVYTACATPLVLSAIRQILPDDNQRLRRI